MLARGWTLGSAQGLKFMHGVIRLYHRPAVRLLEKYWASARPDMVVSLVPNFNRAMFESLQERAARGSVCDDPHRHRRLPAAFLDGEAGAVRDLRQRQSRGAGARAGLYGGPDFPRVGMILRPTFYQPVTVDRTAERNEAGARSGPSYGSGAVRRARLEGDAGDRRAAFGHAAHFDLREELGACRSAACVACAAPRYVEGFTPEIPYYMSLADFFIGKPGPGSISEAVAMGLPVIVERNIWTLPQERYNADWVLERNAGLVLPNFRGIGGAVEELLRDLPRYQAAVKQIHNRAVFEIPDILAKILG